MAEWFSEGIPTGESRHSAKAIVLLNPMFYTYILKSRKDGTYYYGHTENLRERLKTHNAGRVKYTKGHRPYQLYYSEKFETRSEAFKRERFFKSIDGYNWLKSNGII